MKKYRNIFVLIITWLAALSMYTGDVLVKEGHIDTGLVMIIAGTAWITCFLIANLSGTRK